MSLDLSRLNSVQYQIVTADPANMMILAGAGSGKTSVITTRMAWLLKEKNVFDSEILAVTFTNKAAGEMKERLSSLIGRLVFGMWIGTFHGIAHKLLRIHYKAVGLNPDFQIMDQDEELKLIKTVQKTMNLSEEKYPPKRTMYFINEQKDKGFRALNVKIDARDFIREKLRDIYYEYEKTCLTNNVIDFNDLLLYAYELFQNNPDILRIYQNKFKYIFVDEFQDTNDIQYAWLKKLSTPDNYLTVVGDDDQSIYGWRGANIQNMQYLQVDFPDLKIIKLEQNYRSTGIILKAANKVIAQNRMRLGKNLWTDKGDGELISLYAAPDDIKEADYVVSKIESYLKTGKFSPKDIAILYRSNAQSRLFEEKLINHNIPYRIYGNVRFTDRAEVKNALAYVRLITNNNDNEAFLRIVNFPTRGLGETTIEKLITEAEKENQSYLETMRKLSQTRELSLFSARVYNAFDVFLKLIDFLTELSLSQTLSQFIDSVILHSGLYDFYRKESKEIGSFDVNTKVENLEELVSVASRFTNNDNLEGNPISIFLAQLVLESNDDKPEVLDSVQLMTLHSAKGLEFPIVFMVGMEDGLFPHQLSIDTEDDLEEERRLCYVGMTRAKVKLIMTHAFLRRIHGQIKSASRSMFIADIPEEFLETNIKKPFRYESFSANEAPSSAEVVKTSDLIGKRIIHKKFGHGVILDFSDDDDLKIQVKFPGVGVKWLLANHPLIQMEN